MAMPPPSPSFFLLDSHVHDVRTNKAGGVPLPTGCVITSGEKMAFGFSEPQDEYDVDPNSLVRGLDIEAVFSGEADLSFLALRGDMLARGGHQYSCIHTIDKNLILIASAFVEIYPFDVLIIYDAIDRSLRMIPFMPHTYPPVRADRVVVGRSHDDDTSYALVYPGTLGGQDVLFVARSSFTSSSDPWETKRANFPDYSRPNSEFRAGEVFSFRGRCYWADLLCGVLYCDFSDVLSDDIDRVDILSLDLPAVGCKKHPGDRDGIPCPRAFRAMGPVGDSIKFVSIDGYLEHVAPEDCKVRVWTLMEDLSWAVEHELGLASLHDGVEFKGDVVPPEMAPMYPFLSTQEDDVIYFSLGSLIRCARNYFPTEPRSMLRVDLHNKTVKRTELSESQRASMQFHLALSSNAADKLLRGSCRPSHVEDLKPMSFC